MLIATESPSVLAGSDRPYDKQGEFTDGGDGKGGGDKPIPGESEAKGWHFDDDDDHKDTFSSLWL